MTSVDKIQLPPTYLPKNETLLRKRLRQLDYGDYEFDEKVSSPLISRLLTDLISSTETARQFRKELDDAQRETSVLRDQLKPLRNEIKRLVNENNRLHNENIKLAEKIDSNDRLAESLLRKKENECAELKFLSSQYLHRIQIHQSKTDELKEHLDKVLKQQMNEKEGKFRTKDQKIMLQIPKIDVETGLAPTEFMPAAPPLPDLNMIDVLKTAELRCEALEREREEYQARAEELENKLSWLKTQVDARESEIQRLGVELEISRSQQFNPLGLNMKSIQKEDQVDPQEAAFKLPIAKQRIDQLESQIEHLHEYTESLEKKIEDYEKDRTSMVKAHQDDRQTYSTQLQKEKNNNQILMKNIEKLQGMINEIEKMNSKSFQKDGSKKEEVTAKIDTGLSSNAKKIRQHAEMEEKLKTTEKNLLLTNQQLKNAKITMNSHKAKLEEAELELKTVKAELEVANGKIVSVLAQNQDNEKKLSVKYSNTAPTSSPKAELVESIEKLEKRKEQLETNIIDQTSALDDLRDENELLRRTIALLENENIDIHSKFDEIQQEVFHLLKLNRDMETQVDQNKKEKDQLKQTLTRFEEKLNEMTHQAELLAQEKQNLEKLYEQTNMALEECRNYNPGYQETRVSSNDASINNSQSIVGSSAAVLKTKEETLTTELGNLRKDLDSKNTEIENLKKQISQEKACFDEKFVVQSNNQTNYLSGKLDHLHQQLKEKEEIIQELDRSRDELQTEVDHKAEIIADFADKIKVLKKDIAVFEADNAKLLSEVSDTKKDNEEKGREINSLVRQVDMMLKEKEGQKEKLSAIESQLNHCRHELEQVSLENSLLQQDLQQVFHENTILKEQLEMSENRTTQLDSIIKEKESERHDTLISYRKLIVESERMEASLKAANEMTHTLRMELIMRDKHIDELQNSREEDQIEIKRMKSSLHSVEKQLNQLTKLLAAAERNVKNLESEKARILREIATTRDLSSTIERSKQELHERLMVLTSENEGLMSQLHKIEAEKEVVNDLLNQEKLKVDRLEHMMILERTKKAPLTSMSISPEGKNNNQDTGDIADNNTSVSIVETDRALVLLNKQLEDAKEQIKMLKTQLAGLEHKTQDAEKRKRIVEQENDGLHKRLYELGQELANKKTIILDMISQLSSGGPPAADVNQGQISSDNIDDDKKAHSSQKPSDIMNRIQSELDKTRDELKSYEGNTLDIVAKFSESFGHQE